LPFGKVFLIKTREPSKYTRTFSIFFSAVGTFKTGVVPVELLLGAMEEELGATDEELGATDEELGATDEELGTAEEELGGGGGGGEVPPTIATFRAGGGISISLAM